MKVQTARDCYQESTAKASDIVRQLALAGIAVVWIFKVGTGIYIFPSSLLSALEWFCITLGLDLAQYVVKAATWGIFQRMKERQLQAAGIDPEGESPSATFDAPIWFNWAPIYLFWGKCSALVVGGVFLYMHLRVVMVGSVG